MNDVHDQIAELRATASGLPHGAAQVALLEEAVQLADAANDLDLAFDLRDDLMHAANFSGRSDIMLVAYSWCLAQHDRHPGRFDRFTMLWNYKWVISFAFEFPDISRPRLEELLADMERRYQEVGSTLNAVSQMRRKLMRHFGEMQQARAAHAEFRKRRRDFLSDCAACVANENSEYYSSLRQWSRAVQAVEPVLANRITCMEQPHLALGCILIPLIRLGRWDEAKAYHQQGYRLVSRGEQFVRQHAEHLQYLVLSSELTQAKRLLERHLPGAMNSVRIEQRFDFFQAARLWSLRLEDQGTHTVKVRLPEGLPAPIDDGSSEVRTLRNWFTAQAEEIARRFDERNGTSAFQEKIDELPKLLRLAID